MVSKVINHIIENYWKYFHLLLYITLLYVLIVDAIRDRQRNVKMTPLSWIIWITVIIIIAIPLAMIRLWRLILQIK